MQSHEQYGQYDLPANLFMESITRTVVKEEERSKRMEDYGKIPHSGTSKTTAAHFIHRCYNKNKITKDCSLHLMYDIINTTENHSKYFYKNKNQP